MYLISVYFDKKTENKISTYMKQIGKYTGNTFMLDGDVPPHITIAAFRAPSEECAREIFQKTKGKIHSGKVQWVSLGSFLPGVIYIAPVLNEYLHQLSVIYNKEMTCKETLWIDERYLPFQWFPHTTLAKQLTKEQLRCAFEVMQNQFGPFEGTVTSVGLAKTKPYENLEILKL